MDPCGDWECDKQYVSDWRLGLAGMLHWTQCAMLTLSIIALLPITGLVNYCYVICKYFPCAISYTNQEYFVSMVGCGLSVYMWLSWDHLFL